MYGVWTQIGVILAVFKKNETALNQIVAKHTNQRKVNLNLVEGYSPAFKDVSGLQATYHKRLSTAYNGGKESNLNFKQQN